MRNKAVFFAVAIALVVGVAAGTLLTGSGAAQPEAPARVPSVINYQGILVDSATGNPVADGHYDILFSIYDVATGGTALWTEPQTVSVENGMFSVALGSVKSLSATVFEDFPRYLGTKVGGDDEMTPRQLLASVPYAFHAEEADHAQTADNVKQLIQDFVVASGESVTAGDVVSYLDGYIQKGFVVGYAAEHEFNSASAHISVAALSSTKFVVAYCDESNSNYGTAVIGDVCSHSVSYGSEHVFNPAMTSEITVAALSSAKFVAAYRDEGNSHYGTAVIGGVSGNTIAYGAEDVFNPGSTFYISAAALSPTKFVVAYQDCSNSSYGTAVIGSVSGNNIAHGAERVFNPGTTFYISAAALSSNDFVVAYSDEGNSNYGTAVIGGVSDKEIAYGSEHVFNPGSSEYISAAALSPTRFVVAYRDQGNSGYGTAVIGDFLGDTIAYGSEHVFNPGSSEYVSAAALSSTRFVVAYSRTGEGTAVIGDASGNGIAYCSETVFNPGSPDDTRHISAAALTSTKFVAAYADEIWSWYGKVVIGDVQYSGNAIGIAAESGTASQTVPVIVGGVSDVHSGLTPGEVYYSDSSGDLTTCETDYRVGLAISSTEILLGLNTEHGQ